VSWARDWQAARERDYGEEGIAMILVLAVGDGEAEPGLAQAFRETAQTLRPMGAETPAAVLEAMALRELRQAEEAEG